MASAFTTRRKGRTAGRTAESGLPQHSEPSRSPSGVPIFLQKKMAISQPGDAFEQEADRAADAVMSGGFAFPNLQTGAPPIGRKCACGGVGECDDCKDKAAGNLALQRKTDELSIQRQAAEPGASGAAAGEAAPGAGTGTPAAAPADAAAGTPATTPASPGLIVEDSATDVAPGQMKKSEFLAQLRGPTTAAAQDALQGTSWETIGSVAVGPWFQNYAGQSAQQLESTIHGIAPGSAGVTDASAYIPMVSARVGSLVGDWARTGNLPPGVPDIDAPGTAGSVLGSIGSTVSGAVSSVAQGAKSVLSSIGGLLFKPKDGGARVSDDPRAIQAQLGSGEALESGLQGRMNSAFGFDFSAVRVHRDDSATKLSNDLNARAFTVGQDVAFGAGEYQPGSPIGDALIAHELAHVVQQGGASAQAPLQKGEGETSSLEDDADVSAMHAVMSLWGGAKGTLANISGNAIPALKSGLKLRRCSKNKPEIDPTEAKMGERVKQGMEGINAPRPDGKGIYYWPSYKNLCETDKSGRFKWDESYRKGYTAAPQFTHGEGYFTWNLSPKTSASAAIQAWLAGLTIADCASAAVAIEYDTIRAAVGNVNFDGHFGAADKDTPSKTRLRISQYPTEIPLKDFIYSSEVDASDLKPGDWYYFKNHPDYKYKHPAGLWSGENAIYLGKEGETRMWSGFGAAKKKEGDMMLELLGAYNGERDVNDDSELEKIQRDNGGTLPKKYVYTQQGGDLQEKLDDTQAIVNAGGGLMLHEGGWRLSRITVTALRNQ